MSQPGRGLDWFELGLLGALAAVSVWVLALDVWQMAAHGRVWTHVDGPYVPDQMQYLSWIRDAARHGLASNLYVLHPTAHDYLQPAIEISAGLTALGVAPWLALLLWKPVGVAAVFLAVRAYTRTAVEGRWARRAALALALFFGSVGATGDLWLPFWTWGYEFGLLAVAAVAAALVGYARARARGRLSPWPPLLGLLAAWLHPWQGELLILIVLAGEGAMLWATGWRPARGPRLLTPALTIAATALPLAYYAALDRFDLSWRLARAAGGPSPAVSHIALALAPLLACALPAYLVRPRTFLQAAGRAWPPAAVAVWLLSSTSLGATPLHAFAGITIPLAALAVESARMVGFARLPGARALATLLVALATIPASAHMIADAASARNTVRNGGKFITADEQRALALLAADPAPGGVLTNYALGSLVPGMTGRHTYIGDQLWSVPDYKLRFERTFALFWPEPARAARAFVLSTGARFVLAPCHRRGRWLVRELRPISSSIRHFGCIVLYQIR